MSHNSGHFTVMKLILLYLPNLKPYNLYCNHQLKSIVKIKWRQVIQIHSFVMHKHAPSQREGEEITNTIANVLCVLIFCHASCILGAKSTMLTTMRTQLVY